MTRPPHISIVVCTHNRASSLGLTLAALGQQAVPASLAWELVVVDNNSTDATRAIIEAFAATASMDVRYAFVPEQGLSRARNTGVVTSRGDIVAFTDDDVHPAGDWIRSIAVAMEQGDTDIVGGRILPAWLDSPPAWLEHRPAFHGALAIMNHAAAARIVDPRRAPGIWGANMAFRRSVFEKVGLFDTRRGLVGRTLYRGEEIDLIGRALVTGCRAVYDPSLVVWHRIGAERMRIGYLSRLYFQRAEGDALAETIPGGGATLGIPFSTYKSAAGAIASWIAAAARRHPDAIERWLACCAALGSVWGAYKSARRPLSA